MSATSQALRLSEPLPLRLFWAVANAFQLTFTLLWTAGLIGLAMLVTDVLTVDRTPVLAKIDKPLLVLASSSSAELAAQRAIAAGVPGARIVVVEDAGHALFLDQPDAFAHALAAFLAGLAAR